jgi:hypothetical protein
MVTLVGCGLVINKPVNDAGTQPGTMACPQNQSGNCDVPANVSWQPSGSTLSNFRATLDNVDVTSFFSVDNNAQQAVATLKDVSFATPHTFVVSGDIYFLGTFHNTQTSNFTPFPLIPKKK